MPVGIIHTSKRNVSSPLRSRAHHLARAEDQGCRPRVADPHDDRSKSLRIVFRIPRMQRYLLEIKLTHQIHGAYYVPETYCRTCCISVITLFRQSLIQI